MPADALVFALVAGACALALVAVACVLGAWRAMGLLLPRTPRRRRTRPDGSCAHCAEHRFALINGWVTAEEPDAHDCADAAITDAGYRDRIALLPPAPRFDPSSSTSGRG